jgi:urease accessory protein
METLLLLLADGRYPAGGHAHSGGLEAAVATGRITDVADLHGYLLGRLHTQGLVAAAFAAASHTAARSGSRDQLALLDDEMDARTPSPALRRSSRQQGRAQLRAARGVFRAPCLALAPAHPDGPHHPLALGLTTAAAGLGPDRAALLAAYAALTGPASAAVKLLGLDPYRVQAVLAALATNCDAVVREAAAAARKPPAELPSASAPLADITAEIHATWEVRLFAS